MSALYSDTHPQIEALQIELIRRMPPWNKIAVVDSLNETVKTLALEGVRQRHPEAAPEQIRGLLAETMLGVELARKVTMQGETTRITLLVAQTLERIDVRRIFFPYLRSFQ